MRKRPPNPKSIKPGKSGRQSAAPKAEKETAGLESFPTLNPNPIIEVALNGKVTYGNPSACELFPDIQSLGPAHPFLADWENIKSAFCRCASVAQREIAVGTRWYLQSMNYIRATKKLRVYGVDITERKRAEEALRETEARLRSVLDDTRDVIYRLNLKTGLYEYISPSAEAVLGLPLKELVSFNIETLLTLLHPDDRMAVQNAFTQLETTSKAELEYRWRAKDGNYRWLSNNVSLTRDSAGRPLYRNGSVRDITERKLAEQAWHESRNRFRVLTDNVDAGVALIDEHGQFIIVNPAFLRLFDLPSDSEIKNVNDGSWGQWQVFDETGELLAVDEHPVRKAAMTGKPIKNQLVGVKSPSGGPLKWMLVSAETVLKSDGNIDAVICTYHDITNLKEAEQLVFNSNQRLAALMKALPVGVSFSDDTTCQHITGNPALIAQFEATPSANVSASAPDPTAAGRLVRFFHNGRELKDTELPLQRAVAENREIPPTDLDVHMPSGRRWFASASGAPIHNQDGDVIGGVAVTMDITERKQAEMTSQAQHELLRAVLNHMPVAVNLVRGSDLRLHLVNPAYQAIAPGKAMVGRTLDELWQETGQDFSALCRRVLETGEPYLVKDELNMIHRHPDGPLEPAYFTWSLHRVPLSEGEWAILNTAWETTDRKKIEQALQQANINLEQRVQERTAQLRALAGELTFSEQRERRRLAKVLHDHLQQILVAAKFRLAVLGRGSDDLLNKAIKEVDELLDESIAVSRSLTSELSPPILHDTGLNSGLEWLVKQMADNHGLFVRLEAEEAGPLSDDLKVLIFESVRELLFNVVKHAHTRSASINLRRLDGFLQVTVSDQGSGFDPNSLPQAGESGGGFGLFSVRERLALFGGTLEMKTSLGQGSQFMISVPVTMAVAGPQLPGIPVLPEADLTGEAQYPDSSRKVRVMLADDHAIVRQGIANLLSEERDIEVVGQAADGQEAVDLALKLLPDVILMDMSMPKLNGVEATRMICNELPEVVVIGLSMFEETDRARAMRDAGATLYLAKSGPAEELINAIRTSVRPSKRNISAGTPA